MSDLPEPVKDQSKKVSLTPLVIAGIIFVILICLVSRCGSDSSEPEVDEITSGLEVYKVTKSTCLYDGVDIDAEVIIVLSVGTRIGPVGDNGVIPCHINSEGMELCYVKVLGADKKGYVLRQWTDY